MKGWRLLFVISLLLLLWGCASAPDFDLEAETPPEAGRSAERKNSPDSQEPGASNAIATADGTESEKEKAAVEAPIEKTEKGNGASLPAKSGEEGKTAPAAPSISGIPRISASQVEHMELFEDLAVPKPPVRKSSVADSPETGKDLSNKTEPAEPAEPPASAAAPDSAGSSGSTEAASEDLQRASSSRSETKETERRDSQTSDAAETEEIPKREEFAEIEEEKPSEGMGDYRISAEVNEDIQLSLSKKNWIYDRAKSNDSGLEFEGSTYLSDSKEFYFKAVAPGDYDLYFTSQDMETGGASGYHVEVAVREEGAAEVDSEASKLGSSQIDPDGAKASSHSGMFPDGHPREFSNEALEAALSDLDIEAIHRQLWSLHAGYSQPPADEENREVESIEWDQILSAADKLANTKYEALARSILELLLEMGGTNKPVFGEDEGKKRAQIYYLLGGIYESPQQPRDERTAVEYYRKVLEIFPATIYHFKAEDRIKYLERHFLQIR